MRAVAAVSLAVMLGLPGVASAKLVRFAHRHHGHHHGQTGAPDGVPPPAPMPAPAGPPAPEGW